MGLRLSNCMGHDRAIRDCSLHFFPLAQMVVNALERSQVALDKLHRPLLGIGLKIGATFAFTLMAAIARHLGPEIPVGQIVFFRSAFAFIPIVIALLMTGQGLRSLHTRQPLAHARRAFTGVLAMFTYFSALTYLPIADVTAISFASPLIVVVTLFCFLVVFVSVQRSPRTLFGRC